MLRNCAYVDAYANTADIDLEIMHSSNDVSYAFSQPISRNHELKLDRFSILQQIVKRKKHAQRFFHLLFSSGQSINFRG